MSHVVPGLNTALQRSGHLLTFSKMQALGNDFVFVRQADLLEAFTLAELNLEFYALLARAVCDRHLGIGADGLIVVLPAKDKRSAVAWEYLNADGSLSSMCGNGLRCLALYAKQNGLVAEDRFLVETRLGPIAVDFSGPEKITVDLNEPVLASRDIPMAGPAQSRVVGAEIMVDEVTYRATCVSMGNPHCVIFEPQESRLELLSKKIQALPLFPEGVNVELVWPESPERCRVYVYERGAGATLACASGACAVLVAGFLEGRLSRNAQIVMPGGVLEVSWSTKDNHVRLTGPANYVFSGQFNLAPCLTNFAQ